MSNKFTVIDPAAVFAAALSLHALGSREDCETSDVFNGHDQFMRLCMEIATAFETWAIHHVEFASLPDLWVYMLHDNFLAAVESVTGALKAQDLRKLEDVSDAAFPAILKFLLNAQTK